MAKRTLLDIMPHRWEEHITEPDGTFTITTHQDAQPILDHTKAAYNNYGDKLTPGKRGEFHRVASIPLNVWDQWKRETNNAIEKDQKLLAKYLNDPDNKYFKTSPTNI